MAADSLAEAGHVTPEPAREPAPQLGFHFLKGSRIIGCLTVWGILTDRSLTVAAR